MAVGDVAARRRNDRSGGLLPSGVGPEARGLNYCDISCPDTCEDYEEAQRELQALGAKFEAAAASACHPLAALRGGPAVCCGGSSTCVGATGLAACSRV